MLVPIVVLGRLHMLPMSNVPRYAIVLQIGIMKEEKMELLVGVHAAEAACAVILTAWPRRVI